MDAHETCTSYGYFLRGSERSVVGYKTAFVYRIGILKVINSMRDVQIVAINTAVFGTRTINLKPYLAVPVPEGHMGICRYPFFPQEINTLYL
eukprot:UN11435